MSETLPRSVRRVHEALAAAGVVPRIVGLPQSARTAADAAAALGCDAGQIAKSLVFRRTTSAEAVLVIASGTNRVDERRVAAHLNADIVKADAEFVRSATGYAIGGVPPLGHATPIHTLIDEDLLAFPTVWAAAGTPHAVVPLAPNDLVRATGGHVMCIRASRTSHA